MPVANKDSTRISLIRKPLPPVSHGRGHWFDPSTAHHSETSAEQASRKSPRLIWFSEVAFSGLRCESAMMRIALQSFPIFSRPRSAFLGPREAYFEMRRPARQSQSTPQAQPVRVRARSRHRRCHLPAPAIRGDRERWPREDARASSADAPPAPRNRMAHRASWSCTRLISVEDSARPTPD